ncbi:MAG TPA: L,D-transpeptidase [Xanthobacteraceae bacterium]|nr:L,D-transpeptidase [Xanthobacteraceae bacterium]
MVADPSFWPPLPAAILDVTGVLVSARKSGSIALIAALAVALGAAPAAARYKVRHERSDVEHTEPFGSVPKGPLQIFISIDQQKLHLYSDGVHVADTSVATGVLSLPTPLGVFSVIQKQVFHRSNLYSNAPMPFMQRITWSGVAMHEGESIGHRASHGCIRMPHDFAVRLYHLTRIGVPVVIADPELKPTAFADPHLFVHRAKPPAEVAADPKQVGLRAGSDVAAAPDGKPSDLAPTAPAPAAVVASAVPAVFPAAKPDIAAALAANTPDPPGAKADPVAADAAAAPAAPEMPASAAPAAGMPPALAAALATDALAKNNPIAIFISRKEKKIYVRQDFTPLFDAPVSIADPVKPLGTHVFTALDFSGDDRTVLRWDVVSLPGEPPKAAHPAREERHDRHGRLRRDRRDQETDNLPPPDTPAEALARIDIPPEAIDYISQLIVPGSSLIVSDQGLGDETGEGTNFIVVTH